MLILSITKNHSFLKILNFSVTGFDYAALSMFGYGLLLKIIFLLTMPLMTNTWCQLDFSTVSTCRNVQFKSLTSNPEISMVPISNTQLALSLVKAGSTFYKVPKATADRYYQAPSNLPENSSRQKCRFLKSGSRLIMTFIDQIYNIQYVKPILIQFPIICERCKNNVQLYNRITARLSIDYYRELGLKILLETIIIGMGNQIGKICGNNPKPYPPKQQKIPAVSQTSSTPQLKPKETRPEMPSFINPTIRKNMQNRENLFQGLVSTYHGQPRQQWKPISDQFYYKGEWSADNMHGHGYLYDKNQQSLLVGCFYQNNLIPAKYRKIFSNQTQYLGQINAAFEMHGNGEVVGKSFKYVGELKNNKFDGEGKLDQGEIKFEGTFSQGQKVKGVQTSKKGVYEGSFENNQREGEGVWKWADGGRFEGTFHKNKIDGKGKLFDSEGCYCGVHTFEEGKLLI